MDLASHECSPCMWILCSMTGSSQTNVQSQVSHGRSLCGSSPLRKRPHWAKELETSGTGVWVVDLVTWNAVPPRPFSTSRVLDSLTYLHHIEWYLAGTFIWYSEQQLACRCYAIHNGLQYESLAHSCVQFRHFPITYLQWVLNYTISNYTLYKLVWSWCNGWIIYITVTIITVMQIVMWLTVNKFSAGKID